MFSSYRAHIQEFVHLSTDSGGIFCSRRIHHFISYEEVDELNGFRNIDRVEGEDVNVNMKGRTVSHLSIGECQAVFTSYDDGEARSMCVLGADVAT